MQTPILGILCRILALSSLAFGDSTSSVQQCSISLGRTSKQSAPSDTYRLTFTKYATVRTILTPQKTITLYLHHIYYFQIDIADQVSFYSQLSQRRLPPRLPLMRLSRPCHKLPMFLPLPSSRVYQQVRHIYSYALFQNQCALLISFCFRRREYYSH